MDDIYLLFLVGFFGSLHCIGMCGPIVIAYSVSLASKNEQTSLFRNVKILLNHISYNLGRTITYVFFGIAAGFLGSLAFYFKENKPFIMMFFGSLMILFSLILFGILRKFEKYFISPVIFKRFNKNKLSELLSSDKVRHRLYFGLVNGFFPCALTYSAILKSLSTGSPVKGGIGMALFGIGTIPMLVSVGYFAGFFGKFLRNWGDKLAGLFILFMGMRMLYKGIISM